MRLLDLFCGAGGAGVGYHRAGFEVVGVDIRPQPRYPFAFVQFDALDALDALLPDGGGGSWTLTDFDAIHASPPCQHYSSLAVLHPSRSYVDLYETTRALLQATRLPYVIENVIGAPYRSGVMLCGSMFGMPIRRHRNFETSFLILGPQCRHREQREIVGIYGHSDGHVQTLKGTRRGPRQATTIEARAIMEMPWAKKRKEITEAVPPAYTEYIGHYLAAEVKRRSKVAA